MVSEINLMLYLQTSFINLSCMFIVNDLFLYCSEFETRLLYAFFRFKKINHISVEVHPLVLVYELFA
jgi:hypothetical protein